MKEPVAVCTLVHLAELAEQKRSVITANGNTRLPAAVIMNMTGKTILKFINFGLYVYEKQEKTK